MQSVRGQGDTLQLTEVGFVAAGLGLLLSKASRPGAGVSGAPLPASLWTPSEVEVRLPLCLT